MTFLHDNLLGILIACVIILVFIIIRRRLNYFTDKDLIYFKPSWKDIIYSIILKDFMVYPSKVYDKTRDINSPYVGFFTMLLKPSILIRDPSLVTNVLIKDFSHFNDHGFDIDLKTNPLAEHLFNMNGDHWRTLRQKLVPTFTSGKLRGMVPIMEECADSLIKEIKDDPSLQTDTNLKDLFKKYSLSVIASTAFGIDPESVKAPDNQFKNFLYNILTPNFIKQLRFMMIFAFPFLNKLLKIKMFDPEDEEFVLSLTRQSLEHRKKTGIKRNDFIQLLLELKEKGSVELDVRDLEQDEKEAASLSETTSTKLEFTDELLAAQVFVFLIGGFENIALLCVLTMYTLSKHPEIQSRARQEVREAKAKNNGLDYQALREMKLLGAAIDETLRLHSPNILIMRKCNKTYTFSDGKVLDKDTGVLIPAKSLHLDPNYWSNPKEFIPERFFSKTNIIPGTYIPFGDGPRVCIAQRLALLMSKVMVAQLLLNFDLLPSEKTKEPVDVRVKLTADTEGGFWGSFKEISD